MISVVIVKKLSLQKFYYLYNRKVPVPALWQTLYVPVPVLKQPVVFLLPFFFRNCYFYCTVTVTFLQLFSMSNTGTGYSSRYCILSLMAFSLFRSFCYFRRRCHLVNLFAHTGTFLIEAEYKDLCYPYNFFRNEIGFENPVRTNFRNVEVTDVDSIVK
jgi:hypothetical protein